MIEFSHSQIPCHRGSINVSQLQKKKIEIRIFYPMDFKPSQMCDER